MLVFENKLSWVRLVVQMRGTVLVHIWARLAVTMAVAVAITLLHHERIEWLRWNLTPLPFQLIGLALSIILGFRNQTCYQRFWEGRQLWGQLINTSRTLCRQVLTLIDSGDPRHTGDARTLQHDVVHQLCAYAHLLRIHLRGLRDVSSLARLIPREEVRRLTTASNPPAALLLSIGERLAEARRRGWVDDNRAVLLEEGLRALTDVQGGCERIKNTPIPFTYTLLIHRIAGLYCLALPLGIVTTTGPYTPLVALLVAYAFFGLDAIGDEIEDPFGLDLHDLPLDQMSTMIEINLREALGETDLPPPVRPRGYVLT
jgi:ion channel-forming bestrophin family protein